MDLSLLSNIKGRKALLAAERLHCQREHKYGQPDLEDMFKPFYQGLQGDLACQFCAVGKTGPLPGFKFVEGSAKIPSVDRDNPETLETIVRLIWRYRMRGDLEAVKQLQAAGLEAKAKEWRLWEKEWKERLTPGGWGGRLDRANEASRKWMAERRKNGTTGMLTC